MTEDRITTKSWRSEIVHEGSYGPVGVLHKVCWCVRRWEVSKGSLNQGCGDTTRDCVEVPSCPQEPRKVPVRSFSKYGFNP